MSLHEVLPVSDDEARRRAARRAAERRRTKFRRRTVVMFAIGLGILAAAAFGAWAGLKPLVASFTAVEDYPGPGSGEVLVQVAPGDSGQRIAATLQKAGVVRTAKAFLEAEKANPAAAKGIQPGTYRLASHMAAADAFAALVDPASRVVSKVTVPEGKRLGQTLDLLAQATGLAREEFAAAAKDATRIGLPEQAKGNSEGYLFPATYEFQPGVTATEMVRAMVAREQQAMTALGIPPEEQRAVLIKASLVQAEGSRPQDFGKIAQVVENRLARGMKLNLDTTVHYATGRFTLSTSQQDTQVKSPYNTYYVQGLPVGPIDSPGEAAIQAVVEPTAGPWLWFTTVNPDTGDTRFASTPAEKEAMDVLWRAWQHAHPNR